ncbi:MAG: ABC transporter ATP-binding protein [Rhodospirillales bacterium]|nr:ABC transporter ATP-binding protein [Rhodospirillales bacterium]
MTDAVMIFDHASKVYDGSTVLDDVVLNVAPGETLALVGHNGAGKTTMMKLLLGLIRPSTGTVRVLGLDPAGPDGVEAKRALGFLPETVAFQQAMSGLEVLNFYARLKGADLADNMTLLEKVGLADAARQRVKTYSKGMRQRLGLAQALLGSPRLMLLDEPTSGLDPATRRQFYDTISALRDDGVTVLMSSHALSEFETHVDRIAIMNAGRLKASGTLAELRHGADIPVRIRLRTREAAATDIASRLPGADVTRVNGCIVEFSCTPENKMNLVRRVTDMGVTIEDIEIDLPSLDQLYRHYRNGDAP